MEMLKWNTKIADDTIIFFLEQMVNCLVDSLKEKTASHKNGIDEIKELFRSLPKLSIQRILLSPEFFYSILPASNLSTTEFCGKIREWIIAEKIISGQQKTNIASPIWTAKCDFKVKTTSLNRNISPAILYTAPQINDIVIDFKSPATKRKVETKSFRAQFGPTNHFTEKEQTEIYNRIKTVLEVIKHSSPNAYHFIIKMIRQIIVRKDSKIDKTIGSSSSYFIGRFLIHIPPATIPQADYLADIIVHESIHSFLYIEHLKRGLYSESFEIHNSIITSPWTSNTLSHHSFIHACHVWYGLCWFWSNPFIQKEMENYNFFIERAVKGFKNNSLSELMVNHKIKISQETFDNIDKMQKDILYNFN